LIRNKIYLIAAVCFSALCFNACNINELDFDNIETPLYTPVVVAPIGTSTYTIAELIDQLNDSTIAIEESPSGLISVVYRDTSFFDDTSEFIVIGDVTNNGVISPGVTLPTSPIDTALAFTEELQFDYQPDNSEELDSVYFSSGTASITVVSTFTSDVDIELRLFSITNYITGDTMVFSGTIAAGNSYSQNIPMENFRAIFERVGGINIFKGEFNGILDVKTGSSVAPSDFLSYTLTFTDPAFAGIFGYFGEESFSIQDQSIELDFFKDIEPGGLEFGSPQIAIMIENSFGVPMGVILDQISSSNNQGTQVFLTGTITETPQLVRSPDINSVGGSLATTITIKKDNSNIDDLLNISPSIFNFSVTADANFGNEVDKERNFLTDSSKVETIIEVTLPLDVKLDSFVINLDFGIENFDFDEADTLKFRISSVNDLPFTGTTDIQFLAADSTVLLEKANVLLILSPEIGPSGKVETPTQNETVVVLTEDEIQLIQNANTITLQVNIDSWQADSDQFVKIFTDYELVMKLSVIGNIKYDI